MAAHLQLARIKQQGTLEHPACVAHEVESKTVDAATEMECEHNAGVLTAGVHASPVVSGCQASQLAMQVEEPPTTPRQDAQQALAQPAACGCGLREDTEELDKCLAQDLHVRRAKAEKLQKDNTSVRHSAGLACHSQDACTTTRS
uniref:Uncharacterized protein n=1 Tax=Chlamydomonas euryale TaxID=1486919 RepID=A0A7R9V9F5_9CHLO|mmetsp:Transcript_27388/g.81170  ORF Transcript_27388/g.81170 Transcript_27388/m.81170 type:complete len:145 (+) Transcript_27388:158-592(+)